MNTEVAKEQQYFIEIVKQMKQIHADNKSVVSTLEFIEDCVHNRMEKPDAN